MKEYTYTLTSPYGLHARPAGQLVRLAKEYDCAVTMRLGEKSCDVKRLMALMALGAKQGSVVTLQADGPDEAACIEALGRFLAENV